VIYKLKIKNWLKEVFIELYSHAIYDKTPPLLPVSK